MSDTNNMIPSLLHREATGGEIAERGLSFQEAVLMAHIPRWLAEEGFTALIRESYGDIEAMFFAPGMGYVKEFVEVKDHTVTSAEFRQEFQRFCQMAAASPNTIRWFTLVCPSLADGLKPLVNGLRHLRDPYPFYAPEVALQEASYADYEHIVLKMGDYTNEDARFLFQQVEIKAEYGHAASGEALFRQALLDHQPQYNDLSQTTVTAVFSALSRLLNGRLRVPVTRREIETVIKEAIPESARPPIMPTVVRTLPDANAKAAGLRFAWDGFFGTDTRTYPPTSEWTSGVVTPLREARIWINEHRLSRRIRLEGSRRLSAAYAIGAAFSAVTGCAIEMNHRGQAWVTDAHPQADTPPYALQISCSAGVGDDLVVVFGILRDIAAEVADCLPTYDLQNAPVLYLTGEAPVVSSEQANLLVAIAKQALSSTLAECGSRRIHLFYAGPSHVILFLGHRLNATAAVQCYEWVAPNTYVPTCLLT